MRLRQIALAAHDLDAATDLLCDVLGIEIGFRDPGVAEIGLVNAVMPVGSDFLQVVSPPHPGPMPHEYRFCASSARRMVD